MIAQFFARVVISYLATWQNPRYGLHMLMKFTIKKSHTTSFWTIYIKFLTTPFTLISTHQIDLAFILALSSRISYLSHRFCCSRFGKSTDLYNKKKLQFQIQSCIHHFSGIITKHFILLFSDLQLLVTHLTRLLTWQGIWRWSCKDRVEGIYFAVNYKMIVERQVMTTERTCGWMRTLNHG